MPAVLLRAHVPLLVSLLAASGCGERREAAPDAGVAPPPLPPPAARMQALLHETLPEVDGVLARADPVAGARKGALLLRPPPWTPGEAEALLDARDRVFRNLADLSEEVLDPRDAVLLRVARFGLSAFSDRLRRRRPTRRAPDAIVLELERFLAEVTWEASHGEVEAARGALAALPAALEGAFEDLGGTSIPAGRAAAADLRRLVADLGRLEGILGRETVGRAMAALSDHAQALDRRLPAPEDPARPFGDRTLGPVGPAGRLVRLDERWAPEDLTAHLAFHEAVTLAPAALLPRLEAVLAHLSALDLPPPPRGPRRPVTRERCAEIVATLDPVVHRFRQLEGARVDCDAWVLRMPRRLGDAEAAYRIARDGYVAAARRARQAAEHPTVALVTGRAAEAVQPLAQSLALLVHAGRKDAAALAAREARAAVCTALAALYLHGRVGPPEALPEKLAPACPDPAGHVEQALARPHRALAGLGLLALPRGPASLAALDRYPWLPVGLVEPVAVPEPPGDGPPPLSVQSPDEALAD